MIKINLEGKDLFFSNPIKLVELTENNRNIMCGLINNRIRPLDYIIKKDSTIKLLKMDDDRAVGVYKHTLRFIFLMALYNVYPKYSVKLSYNISRSFLASPLNFQGFSEEMKENIEKEMKKIISSDLPISKLLVNKQEAIKLYTERNMKDKIQILQYRPENMVHLHKCNNYINYMYGYIAPSTGYIKNFQLVIYEKGLALRYPRAEINGEIPPFEDESTYAQSLKKAYKRARLIEADTIFKINQHLEDPIKRIEFVNMCEARQNSDLAELADKIIENIKNVKLICIAGPSSSGKTTFSNRLRIQMMAKGIKPVKVSVDDYYLDRRFVPKTNGKVDFEDINIIDIPLLNQHLVALINGQEVTMPSFNFKTGERETGKTIQLQENQPIIIEGIHALNDKLTPLIDRKHKYKIYIAPHSQVNIDNHNPISAAYARLLRRIVRDYQYRGYSAEKTLAQWESVRLGEFKWIYENEEGVDYVYNSDLTYEIAVLKKHALKLLKKIPESSPNYPEANTIMKFLKLYKDCEDELVPCNSLLREFIGGSCFKDV